MQETSNGQSIPASERSVRFIDGLAEIASRYDVLFCDVWGVLHDGLRAFPAASMALTRYRDTGGRVILVSNAPRPGFQVAEQLDGFGVPRSAYDAIRTSGDLTRALVASYGTRPMHHIGPARDLGLFDGLEANPGDLAAADYVVCTGLFEDETETIEDYGPVLADMRRRNLPMICANPDIVVERGERLILCAGAVAAAYEDLGGEAVTAGKPHPPIYRAALDVAIELLGEATDTGRVLGVGDAMRTDIAGGHAAGIDTLLVMRGIHAAELGALDGTIDRRAASAWLDRQTVVPTLAIGELVWS